MLAITFLTTLAWIAALFYYRLGHSSQDAHKNTWGLKTVALVLSVLFLGLLAFRFLSSGMSVIHYLVIGVFGFLIWLVSMIEIARVLSRFWNHSICWESIGLLIVCFAITELIINQVFLHSVIFSNLFVLFIVVIAFKFATRLTKPAFVSFLVAIMLADIYFVWMAASGTATDAGQSWYMEMFHSEFVNHFPFPIGFQWDNHLLGSGDIFFMTMTVMYARRVWSLKAAVIVGMIMTLPILLLPLAVNIFPAPPLAWPYTIFIAPVALILASLRKDDRISASA